MAALIIGLFSNLASHAIGLTITKYLSSLTRRIVAALRAIVVWMVGIVVTLTWGSTMKNYDWESLHPVAIIIAIIGLFTLLFGNFLYNHVFSIACLEEQQQPGKCEFR